MEKGFKILKEIALEGFITALYCRIFSITSIIIKQDTDYLFIIGVISIGIYFSCRIWLITESK